MNTSKTMPDYAKLFALAAGNRLAESGSRKTTRNGTSYEVRWLDEYDPNDRLVGRFRTWTNQLLKPPYRKQVGWERFSLSGEMLDREVRYSRRKTEDYLH
ncbi:hypothetical protein [Granulosicoccus antarcticus]|nr:hypothetical protein [Granulosicoccus antarcticus]